MALKGQLLKGRMFEMLFERLDADVRERALDLWNCKPVRRRGRDYAYKRTPSDHAYSRYPQCARLVTLRDVSGYKQVQP